MTERSAMGAGFKDLVYQDIRSVFMNPEEFGERHTVDGKVMTVVIDGNEVTERSRRQADSGRIEGVYLRQIVLYAAKNEFGPLPATGRILKLDKSTYRVMDAADEGGIYSITLGAVRS